MSINDQITEFFSNILGTELWPPRWYCGGWTEFHGWLYIISDVMIWSAYFVIPLFLILLIRKKPGLPFPLVFYLFGAFILSCGLTHLLDASMFWWPAYRLNALVRIFTAIISWLTVMALIKLFPQISSLKTGREFEIELTERKKAQAALQKKSDELNQSAQYARSLIEASLDPFITISIEGKITDVNEAMVKITGVSREQLIGSDFSHYFTEPLKAQEGYKQVFSKGFVADYPLTIRHKDEKLTHVLYNASIYKDIHGNMLGVFAAARDVTERKKSEDKFRGLLESAPDAIVIVDSDGIIQLINYQTEKLFGFKREEIIGKEVEVLIPARYEKDHHAHRKEFFADPKSRAMGVGLNLFGQHKEGREFPVEISLSPLETGEGLLVSAAIRDVTLQKRAELVIEKSLREKEVLLKEIHHRVKNNLQVTSSLLSLQTEYLSDPRTREIFIESQSRISSIALVHEKLYKSGDLSQVNFTEYSEGLGQLLLSSYGVKPNQIQLKLSKEPSFLKIDVAVPLGLILNELLSNCIKHAFPQREIGEISIILQSESGILRSVCVADNGIGLENDFDIDNTGRLGLQLVQMLVGQLDAKLSITNTDGLAFTINFSTNKEVQ